MPARLEKNRKTSASDCALQSLDLAEIVQVLDVRRVGGFLRQKVIDARDHALPVTVTRSALHLARLSDRGTCMRHEVVRDIGHAG